MDEIIRLENLSYAYPTGRPALRGLNLTVSRGEVVAFLGANGAGKSTLFWHLNGLFRPTGGRIRLDGRDLSSYPVKEVRRRVGLVFQEPDDQLFSPTVAQEIAFGLLNLRLSATEIAARTERYLAMVGLDGYGDRAPHHLSGGEKKRVALAAVLAMEPEVLVLDEPTAGLDPAGTEELVKILVEANRRLGLTVLYSTHDMDLVPELGGTAVVMREGEILAKGPVEEVLQQEDLLRSAGLRPPRVTQLFAGLRTSGKWGAGEKLPISIQQALVTLLPRL